MQKWEYMHVNVEDADGLWKPRYINGRELEGWKSLPPLEIFIAQMGEQGWELVVYSPNWATTLALFKDVNLVVESIRLIFKRPKMENLL